MTPETLKKAIEEARRFIAIAGKVEITKVVGTGLMVGQTWDKIEDYTKESAACERASMDLTRILADLRQGR